MSEHDADDRWPGGSAEDEELTRLSAYVDGEAGAEDAARIEADPALRQRAAELAAARDLLAAPVEPLEEAAWDDIVGAARARVAATAEAPPAPVPAPVSAPAPVPASAPAPASVTELSSRRRARPRAVALIGVAAACLLLVALGIAVARRSGGADRAPDLAAPPTTAVTTTTDSLGGVQGATGSGTTSPAQAADEFRSVYSPTSLGSFADQALLATAAASAAAHTPAPDTTLVPAEDPALAAVARCAASIRRADQRLGRIRFAANATYQDKPVYVLVFQDFGIAQGKEPQRLVVVGRDSCAVALDTAL